MMNFINETYFHYTASFPLHRLPSQPEAGEQGANAPRKDGGDADASTPVKGG